MNNFFSLTTYKFLKHFLFNFIFKKQQPKLGKFAFGK